MPQNTSISTPEDKIFKEFERLVSSPRFRRYRQSTGSKEEAVALYMWNAALCESLYPPLHFFEVTLRNATHNALSALRGNGAINNPRWFMDFAFLTQARHQKQIQDALTQVWSQKSQFVGDPADRSYPKEPQRIVAALTLGFWVNLYASPYATSIVQAIASNVFPNAPAEISQNRRQGDVYPPLLDVLNLRNRVFHHEPIYHWTFITGTSDRSLRSHHQRLCDVLSWMCVVQPAFLQEMDNFHKIHDAGPESMKDAVQLGLWQVQESEEAKVAV